MLAGTGEGGGAEAPCRDEEEVGVRPEHAARPEGTAQRGGSKGLAPTGHARRLTGRPPCCPYDDRVTSCRDLGKGPQAQGHEVDLLATLSNVHLPDFDELRARGVLGTQPASKPAERRALGTGRQAQHHQEEARTWHTKKQLPVTGCRPGSKRPRHPEQPGPALPRPVTGNHPRRPDNASESVPPLTSG